jgi:isopentenyldiphosphate isomerase
MKEEFFDIVDEHGRVIAKAARSLCHGNPNLVHRTVHVVVYHPDGRLLLQRRNLTKDIQPGKWDTAVGGHLDCGESFNSAVVRELNEELGIDVPFSDLKHIFDMKIRNSIESENIRVYSLIHAGPFNFQLEEIDEVKFWDIDDLKVKIQETPEIFTPNLIDELYELGILNSENG